MQNNKRWLCKCICFFSPNWKGKGMSNYAYNYYCVKFSTYQSFCSFEAMEDSVRLFWLRNSFVLPESCKKLLDVLLFNSKHVLGASWMKIEKLVEKTGLSRSTVERCIKLLIQFGVLAKHYYSDKKGGRKTVLVITGEEQIAKIDDDGCEDEPEMPPHPSDEFAPPVDNEESFAANDVFNDVHDDVLQSAQKDASNPDAARVCDMSDEDSNVYSFSSFIKSTESNTKTYVPRIVPSELSTTSIDFIKNNVPSELQNAVGMALTPNELVQLWDRTIKCTKACRSKYTHDQLAVRAWVIVRDMLKANTLESDDIFGAYYGVLRNLYQEFEASLYHDPVKHHDYFYPASDRSSKQYAQKTPFITKAKNRLIKNLAKAQQITFLEAARLHFQLPNLVL